jgi:hypothetical protein
MKFVAKKSNKKRRRCVAKKALEFCELQFWSLFRLINLVHCSLQHEHYSNIYHIFSSFPELHLPISSPPCVFYLVSCCHTISTRICELVLLGIPTKFHHIYLGLLCDSFDPQYSLRHICTSSAHISW